MTKFMNPTSFIAILWTSFQIYTAITGNLPTMIQRPIHVVLGLALTFLIYSYKGSKVKKPQIDQWILSGLSISIGIYVLYAQERLLDRVWFVDPVKNIDALMGILFVILVIEGGRRIVGWALPIVATGFIAYVFAGPYFAGLLYHRGASLNQFIDQQFLSTGGIFGLPIGVANNYVFYFVLFAAFLEISGAGQLFVDLAFSLTRKMRGGTAKAAILASSLLGTINGSAVANVAGTGVFTIPLMKRAGYSAPFAGAVEATASTGGQLMPPIMGAAAFILAETIGIPYSQILLPAAVPALLYYVALLTMVDLKAQQEGITAVDYEEVQPVLPRLHLLIPLAVLVFLISRGNSLMYAAMGGIVTTVILGMLPGPSKLSIADLFTALEQGAKKALSITVPCALAGIIIGVVVQSGLAVKITSLIVGWSFGNLFLTLILVAIGSIVLGIGMPTSSAYIMGAVLMAPALVNMGVMPLAAHLFILYFSIMSMVTPPVALAAYAAGGIADAPMSKTGIAALKLSSSGFIIPFAFALNPNLILQGALANSILAAITALIGVIAMSAAIIGYFKGALNSISRAVLALGALALLYPHLITDLIGFALILLILVKQLKLDNKSLEAISTT